MTEGAGLKPATDGSQECARPRFGMSHPHGYHKNRCKNSGEGQIHGDETLDGERTMKFTGDIELCNGNLCNFINYIGYISSQ